MYLNKVILVGRVASDPESRTTSSGQNVCSFRIATNRVYKTASGERKEEAQFHNIVLWGKQAETASQFVKKGSMLLIEGRIQNRSWEDNSGNKRYITEIIGERIQLGPKSGGGQESQQGFKKEDNQEENIPVIEEGEIDVKDIPF